MRQICVKNMAQDQIAVKINYLRTSAGHSNYEYGKIQKLNISKSIQGN